MKSKGTFTLKIELLFINNNHVEVIVNELLFSQTANTAVFILLFCVFLPICDVKKNSKGAWPIGHSISNGAAQRSSSHQRPIDTLPYAGF